jgi:hypothetical protein
MPKTPIDYSRTHFYKLCCRNPEITDIYVGHTTDFTRRRRLHKSTCCNENANHHNYNVYKYIRENGHWDNWDMVLLETRQCADALEAKKVEREFIENMNAKLNQRVPGRTKKQYREDTHEHIKEHKKNYYEKNKEQILAKCKQYCSDHAEQIKERKKNYHIQHKDELNEKSKQYRERHKDEINERRRQVWAQNRDQLNAKRAQQITCHVCGVQHRGGDKARHSRTVSHQKALHAQSQEHSA